MREGGNEGRNEGRRKGGGEGEKEWMRDRAPSPFFKACLI